MGGRRESVQSPSRRVSNQVFEQEQRDVRRSVSVHEMSPQQRVPEEDMRRMSMREEARYSEEPPYRPQRSSYSGPSPDGYRGDVYRGLERGVGGGQYGQQQYHQEYSRQQLSQSEMHAVVNHHYNTTYRQVDQQLDSAQQLLSSQRSSPSSRPYPVRPKNRNSNVLSAILCLIKEV